MSHLIGLEGVPLEQQDLVEQVSQDAACCKASQPAANYHRPGCCGSLQRGGWRSGCKG